MIYKFRLFHLSPHRDSPQAFSLFDSVKQYGNPNVIVTDRYSAYKVPTKSTFGVKHIRVASFKIFRTTTKFFVTRILIFA